MQLCFGLHGPKFGVLSPLRRGDCHGGCIKVASRLRRAWALKCEDCCECFAVNGAKRRNDVPRLIGKGAGSLLLVLGIVPGSSEFENACGELRNELHAKLTAVVK